MHLLALKTFFVCISKEAENVPTLAHRSLHPESKGNLISLITFGALLWRCLGVAAVSKGHRLDRLKSDLKSFFVNVRRSSSFSEPDLLASTHTTPLTIQPVVFVLHPPSVALSHCPPSLSLRAITLLSLLHIALIFSFSCFEKSDILYLFYRNIFLITPRPPFFTFSFSFWVAFKDLPKYF